MGAQVPLWFKEDRERTNAYLARFGLRLGEPCHDDDATGEVCPGWFFDDEKQHAVTCDECAREVTPTGPRDDDEPEWDDAMAHGVWLAEARRLLSIWHNVGDISIRGRRKLGVMGLLELEEES